MKKNNIQGTLITLLSIVVLLGIWKILSLRINAEIILPPPETVIVKTVQLFGSKYFLASLGATVIRGLLGFLISSLSALIIGVAAGSNRIIYHLIKPVLSVIKSTPVMSIILLALIWFTTGSVPVFTGFLVAFPIMCGNVIEGIRRVDPKLKEMAVMYRVKRQRVLFHLMIPSVYPFFLAGASTALGITWKAVIAAEVLSQPLRALGTGLYTAKVQLETPAVFAWTAVAILLSAVTEKLFHFVMEKLRWKKNL